VTLEQRAIKKGEITINRSPSSEVGRTMTLAATITIQVNASVNAPSRVDDLAQVIISSICLRLAALHITSVMFQRFTGRNDGDTDRRCNIAISPVMPQSASMRVRTARRNQR
jgi:hypothetical protein